MYVRICVIEYTLGEPNPDSHSTKRVRIWLCQSVVLNVILGKSNTQKNATYFY